MHSLLIESIQKLPVGKQQELHPLPSILDQITQAKENKGLTTQSLKIPHSISDSDKFLQHNLPKTTERGVIRGVLSPSSLEKNIFRYNDPTVYPLFNQNQSSDLLQHSHSTSSISSQQSHASQNYYHHYIPLEKSRSNQYFTTSNERRSPTAHSNVRSNTLPRNNLTGTNIIVSSNPDAENNPTNVIHIGLNDSKAFLEKSPTPLIKSNQANTTRSKNLNSSQLSLLSENSIRRNAYNLGIPHEDQNIRVGAIIQTVPGVPNRDTNHSNMPLHLEDLDDLLKYADEQSEENHKENNVLTAKGSNASIGVCSSGYQSITTQSQSSSPVDLNIKQTQSSYQDYGNNVSKRMNNNLTKYGQMQFAQKIGPSHNVNINANNNAITSPLAFKNPLYHLQKSSNNNDSIITPSSSEERLNADYCNLDNGNNYKPVESLSTYGNQRFGNNNRIPRTNPMMQYNKRSDDIGNEHSSNPTSNINEISSRHQRRLSLESARTLSDSSTDTEGMYY